MHIKTKNGWRPLTVKTEHLPFEPEMYSGKIPSPECSALVKNNEREHREWEKKRKTMRK